LNSKFKITNIQSDKIKSLKVILLIIIGFIFALGFIGTVYAVSELDWERSYERADFVFYGEVLSLEILSESTRIIENNNYVDIAGKAIYSIKIHNFIKNSFDDKVISAYGFYYLEKPSGTSSDLYKIGDKLVFYVNIFNENESSYEYLIDYAEVVNESCLFESDGEIFWCELDKSFTDGGLGIFLIVVVLVLGIIFLVYWRKRK